MAMIKCLDCGREVSDELEKCPYCGCPLKRGRQAPGDAGEPAQSEENKKDFEEIDEFLDNL